MSDYDGPVLVLLREFEAVTLPSEVADLLRANNIKGFRYSARWCPVAQVFRKVMKCPEHIMVSVTRDTISWWDRPGPFNPSRYILPLAVQEFIKAFDANTYPDLIKES